MVYVLKLAKMLVKCQLIVFFSYLTFVCCLPQNLKDKQSPQDEPWHSTTPTQDETVKDTYENSANLEFSQNPIPSTFQNSIKTLPLVLNETQHEFLYPTAKPTASNNTFEPQYNVTPGLKDQTNINALVYSSRDSTSYPTRNNDFMPSSISDHFQSKQSTPQQPSPPHRHRPPPHYDDRRTPSHPPFSPPHYRWPPPPPHHSYGRPPYERSPPRRYYDDFSYHRHFDSYSQRWPSDSFYDRPNYFSDDGREPPADRRLNPPWHRRGPPPSNDWRPPPFHRRPPGPLHSGGPPLHNDYGSFSPPNHRPYPPSAHKPLPPDHRAYPIDNKHAPIKDNRPQYYKFKPNSDNEGSYMNNNYPNLNDTSTNSQSSFPPRSIDSESTIPENNLITVNNTQIGIRSQDTQEDNQGFNNIFGKNAQSNKSQRAALMTDDNSPNIYTTANKRLFQVLPVTPEI